MLRSNLLAGRREPGRQDGNRYCVLNCSRRLIEVAINGNGCAFTIQVYGTAKRRLSEHLTAIDE
jgi:hypothetical protein